MSLALTPLVEPVTLIVAAWPLKVKAEGTEIVLVPEVASVTTVWSLKLSRLTWVGAFGVNVSVP